jgi:hypothetical protein
MTNEEIQRLKEFTRLIKVLVETECKKYEPGKGNPFHMPALRKKRAKRKAEGRS